MENGKNWNEELRKIRERIEKSNEILASGKGIFKLEKPIVHGEKEITELPYDFMELTGIEYMDAMDSDRLGNQLGKISTKQAMFLFAYAAAKYVPELDAKDIVEQIGATDCMSVVQFATSFFVAAVREGRMRLERK